MTAHELEDFGGTESVSRANQAAAFERNLPLLLQLAVLFPQPPQLLALSSADEPFGAAAFVAVSLLDPLANRPVRRLELLG